MGKGSGSCLCLASADAFCSTLMLHGHERFYNVKHLNEKLDAEYYFLRNLKPI